MGLRLLLKRRTFLRTAHDATLSARWSFRWSYAFENRTFGRVTGEYPRSARSARPKVQRRRAFDAVGHVWVALCGVPCRQYWEALSSLRGLRDDCFQTGGRSIALSLFASIEGGGAL